MSKNKRLDDAGDREVDLEETIVIRINKGISQGINAAARDVKKLQDGVSSGISQGINDAVRDVKKVQDGLSAGITQGINAAVRDVKKLQDGLSAGISQGINASARDVIKLQDGLSAAEKLVRKAVTRITTGSQAPDDADVDRRRFVNIKWKPLPIKYPSLRLEAKRIPTNTTVIRRRN